MAEELLLGLGSIIALGIAAQWLSWRLRFPAILLLLIFGIIAGPVWGIVEPDTLFGDLLFPLVSVSVAIILFEGGLSLRIAELRQVGTVVRNLTTIGIIVTWILATLAAIIIIGLPWRLAAFLGAILVVTGPTVIIPLLRQIRPMGNVGPIIRWEGIVNDPFGAILAVVVFEALLAGGIGESNTLAIIGVVKALFFGGAIGLGGALVMVLLLRYYLIPDFLQNPVSLMFVVVSYVTANMAQAESGLLAVTIMGIALANQKYVSIKHITEFKENLRVLLISSLFIILAARLTVEHLKLFDLTNWLYVIVLILVVRPVAVYLSTLGSSLNIKEKIFLGWMAPRGIVAAAVSSVFAVRMAEIGYPNTENLVALVFQVIIGTVAIYGISALLVARALKLSQANPQGVLFIGAQPWVQSLAAALRDEGFKVALVDSNWLNITSARKAGCRAYYADALSENLLGDLQLDGIGRLMALTPNDEVNALAALHFVDIFGRNDVYQLPPGNMAKKRIASHLRGRFLFAEQANYDHLTERFQAGAVVKKTEITEEFDYKDFLKYYGGSAMPLLAITESGSLKIFTLDSKPSLQPGQKLVSIVRPVETGEHKK